ncbi:molecular chaperone TorD [Endozoicomonas sp. OPT23]|uniref:molecular chaperone TorD n=1 Tax=Endozoicomonas sp. OPT23 TaxID=2072845 RepID=UPI00129A80C0|nr:molecular chaperone TorD [Endozoicomonas sp. OPT23]MRI32792.1 molecular chaperone TorD [Endozoicomonas sp. OPT23]
MSDTISQNRAQIYWWLSSLVAKELNDNQLQALFSPEVSGFIESLSLEQGLEASSKKLSNAINQLRLRNDCKLELAADYASLFLGAGRSSVQPYASFYLSEEGLLMQQPHHDMIKRLQSYGLAQSEAFNEPADHLAIILDFMGNLAVKDVAVKEQLDCLEQCLLNWLPRWSEDIARHDSFGFYQAVSQLILAFTQADKAFISN